MRRDRPRLLTFAELDAVERVYVRRTPETQPPDPRLTEVFCEHYRLRVVLARAEALVRSVERWDEDCVCGGGRDGKNKISHRRACPVKLLAQDVRRAGGLQ